MSEIIATPTKGIGLTAMTAAASYVKASPGASVEARTIAESLIGMHAQQTWPVSTTSSSPKSTAAALKDRLFESLAQAKIMTSRVAMHLESEWRTHLFAQLDELMAADEWHEDDPPMEASSFATFLRLMLFIKPQRRPGLGISPKGDLILAWTTGTDRLTVQCLQGDLVRWSLSCEIGGERERSVGEAPVQRFPEILTSYQPARWFSGRS